MVESGETVAAGGTYAFDEAALAAWMAANVPGFAGPMAVTKFAGGQSNPTYLLSTPGARYVLRRNRRGRC